VKTRRSLLVLVVGSLILLLVGCVSLPQGGGVRTGPDPEQHEQSDAPFDYDPEGPRPGAARVDVVGGYLLAMQATPLSTAVAREFLTERASTGWVPEKSTVVYGTQSLESRGRAVRVDLADTVRLGGRGEWLGDTTGGRGVQHDLRMVRERGEWRISDPPDALIVPQEYFETRFAQYFLYFLDRSAQILVPEPVYLPRGEQTPTLLVRGLLRGPDEEVLGATRTFIPDRTALDDLSVLVSDNGTAAVPLSQQILDLDGTDLDMALGQLAWTLRQVPGVETMQVSVDGSPLNPPGEGGDQDVQGWPELDPSVNWASQSLFGIRDGRVVTLVGDQERRIAGFFGTEDSGLRSIAVDLAGERVAGVTDNSSKVLVAPRAREAGQLPNASNANVVLAGATNLLPPVWDIYGQLWLVDRERGGANLAVVRSGVPTELDVPGLTSANVRAFELSRDGTRLAAVVAGRQRDRLVVARVMRSDGGKVRGFSPVTRLPVGSLEGDEIRDLAWRTPASLALLTRPSPGESQVIVALIDGSSTLGEVATDAEVFPDKAVRIVTSPASGAPVYVGTTNRQLFELGASGRWTVASVDSGLRSPTFVG
jgi:hypothetical protein